VFSALVFYIIPNVCTKVGYTILVVDLTVDSYSPVYLHDSRPIRLTRLHKCELMARPYIVARELLLVAWRRKASIRLKIKNVVIAAQE